MPKTKQAKSSTESTIPTTQSIEVAAPVATKTSKKTSKKTETEQSVTEVAHVVTDVSAAPVVEEVVIELEQTEE
jgi:hypothetical protein